MKLLKSLIALALVIVLGLAVYFYVYKAELAKKELAAHEKMLVRFDLDNIKGFTFYRPDEPIVFERGVGRLWYITSPIKTDAEKEVVFNLFESLHTSEILFTIAENPDDLSPYGLSEPVTYMAMEYTADEPDTIFIGNSTPDGTMSYVRFASEKRVLSIDKSVTDRMKRDLNFYRTRNVLNVIDEDIIGVDIVRGESDQITMAYTGYSWIMKNPWEMNGDDHNMNDLTDTMSKIGIRSIVTEQSDDLSQFGLDNPRYIFTVSLKYGMPDRIVLIGDEVKIPNQKRMTYLKVFDRDAIMLVDNALVSDLSRVPTWFIEKNPVNVYRERVNKIVFDTRGNVVTFVKDSQNNWFISDPIDKNIQIETINKIWGLTSNILIQGMHKYDPTEKDVSDAGFDDPFATITLYENDTVLDGTIFGKTMAAEDPITYYMTMKRPNIFISKAPITADINKILNTVFSE